MKKVLYILSLFIFSFTQVFGQTNSYTRADTIHLTNTPKTSVVLIDGKLRVLRATSGSGTDSVYSKGSDGFVHLIKVATGSFLPLAGGIMTGKQFFNTTGADSLGVWWGNGAHGVGSDRAGIYLSQRVTDHTRFTQHLDDNAHLDVFAWEINTNSSGGPADNHDVALLNLDKFDVKSDSTLLRNYLFFTSGITQNHTIVADSIQSDSQITDGVSSSDVGQLANGGSIGTNDIASGDANSINSFTAPGGETGFSLQTVKGGGGGDKEIYVSTGTGSVPGLLVHDSETHVGYIGDEVFPISDGKQYAQYDKVDSLITAATGGGGGVAATGSISLANIESMISFGDSFTIGYGLSTVYQPYPVVLSILLGQGGVNNQGVSNTGVFYSTQVGYQNIAPQNTTKLITWMAGLNDIRQNGATTACITQIQGNLSGFLANAFARYIVPGNYSVANGSISTPTKTGTWGTTDMSGSASKSQYLSGLAASSSTSGSTFSFNIDANTSTIAIGTFSDDGSDGNTLGAFQVYINNVLYTTYTPTGRNTGISNPTPATQHRMPEAILIPGVAGSTVKITTTSNTLTVIDYIAAINAPQNCAPVVVLSIPKLTTTGYATAPANASDAAVATGNAAIQATVSTFAGLPVYYIDVNNFYNTTNTQADGIHPNPAGAQQIAYGVFPYFQGNTAFFYGEDKVINQITVGQGHGSVGNGGFNLNGATLGNKANNANVSGTQMIAIGGSALKLHQSNSGNIAIGYNSLSLDVNHGYNTSVGDGSGSTVNSNYNTIYGRVNPTDPTVDKSVVIGDGANNIRYEYRDANKSVMVYGGMFHKTSPVAINATATATGTQLASSYITSTSAAATTITLPTATAMATALTSSGSGASFDFIVDNTAGANTVTLILGSGMTLLNSSVLTVPSGTTGIAKFELVFSSATACTVQRVY